jgi:hypothetical protein
MKPDGEMRYSLVGKWDKARWRNEIQPDVGIRQSQMEK